MRLLKKEEHDLIVYLLRNNPNFESFLQELPSLTVEEMNDGGMGSLRFLYKDGKKSIFKDEVAIINIRDMVGVSVRYALNMDMEGNIYELDVFKGDFSKLKKFPTPPYDSMRR